MSQLRVAKVKNASRGEVHVKSDGKDNLTLQIPSVYAQHYYGLKQKYISFGAKDTPQNRVLAMTAAIQMNTDLELGVFNPQKIASYQHPRKQSVGRYEAFQVSNEVHDLLGLYKDFVKQLTLAETTRRGHYEGTYQSHLSKMISEKNYALDQQSEIAAWIKENATLRSTVKLLAILHRLIEWGKQEDRLPKDLPNKFKAYEQELRKALRTINTSRKSPKIVDHLLNREGIKAWTEAERDLIIKAFYNRPTRYNPYLADYVACAIEFLFNTGCRHGEAFALTWGDISSNFATAQISKSYASKYGLTKGTKTGKVRTIPLNARAQALLEGLKPIDATKDTLVFITKSGKHCKTTNFQAYWNPSRKTSVIGRLIQQGVLTCYLDMYSTRRTFASLQINKGVPVTTVAKWIGDDPATLLKHYARPDDDAVPY